MPRKPAAPADVTAERVKLDRGGYTSSGQYFGVGAPLWAVWDEQDPRAPLYVRAGDKKAAIAQALLRRPGAKPAAASSSSSSSVGGKPRAPNNHARSVAAAVNRLSKQRLETALFEIVASLYLTHAGWKPYSGWPDDWSNATFEEIVASIPGEVLRAIPGNEDGGE